MVKEKGEEEEKIINIRINSDDLFAIIGWLSLLSNGVPILTEITREVVLETTQRIGKLNKNNKEFLEALDSQWTVNKEVLQQILVK